MVFANIVLLSTPVVAIILFRVFEASKALLVLMVFSYLFWPEQPTYNLPGLPQLDKSSIPALLALFIILILSLTRQQKNTIERWIPRNPLAIVCILAILITPILTVMTNRAPVIYGETILPGLRPWDIFSSTLSAMMFILPLFLGKRLLATPDAHRQFLIILSIACLIYSPLILYEVRMSPQLSRNLYGYFPHNWLQHVRNDGFRPVVFLHHGLWLASFLALGVLASFALAHQSNNKNRKLFLCVGLWLLFVLFLSKSIGALMLALILTPFILITRVNTQLLVAAVFGLVVVLYPLLRSNDLAPVENVASLTEKISPERALSFEFRVRNEDLLLEKALQKPVAGWGGWGRSAVFDETGREQTVPDGYWIVAIGLGGWLKYLSEFCLLALPMGLAWVYRKRLKIGAETSALCLILACNLVDLIPNSTITPVTWVLAGAIWGRLEIKNTVQAEEPHTPQTSSRQRNSYTRFADRAGPEPHMRKLRL